MSRSRCFLVVGLVAAVVPSALSGINVARADESGAALTKAHAAAQASAKLITLPSGLKLSVWASEPMFENPVSFGFDEQGHALVAETHRIDSDVLESRARRTWPSPAFRAQASPQRLAHIEDEILDRELASHSVADREKLLRTYFVGALDRFTKHSERIVRLSDSDNDGIADRSTVFADGFSSMLEGLGAGVLARKGDVYYTNIPNLWRLRDRNGDGADQRTILSTGYGIRYGFIGHDMHGLRIGPDGKLYWSIGDRGAHVEQAGRIIESIESGAVFRCNLDGSDLELFAHGLRNPQELAFDQFGDLFTVDNNSDAGDKARLVYVVEGGDSGWRVGYQYLEAPRPRGPWNSENLWSPPFPGQAAYIVPPVANIASGPAGLTFHPGTGAPAAFKNRFFLADFRGQASISGIHSFGVTPAGAGFDIDKPEKFAWGVLATDVDFGPDGALYVLDWVNGWSAPGKGRIYRITDARPQRVAETTATQALIAHGIEQSPAPALVRLLAHPDQRVRQEAQFALVAKQAHAELRGVAERNSSQLARLHAVWGLGQLIRPLGVDDPRRPAQRPQAVPVPAATVMTLVKLMGDPDAQVRAAAAKVLGEGRRGEAFDGLLAHLADPSPRVQFFAALSLGKLGRHEAAPALVELLAKTGDPAAVRDPYLRHAAVTALTWLHDESALTAAAHDPRPAVRMGVLLTLRRWSDAKAAAYLSDSDPLIAREAARAVNDVPITAGFPALLEPAIQANAAADPAIMGRVINAAFRTGTLAGARRLTELVRDPKVADETRRDALLALGDWPSPPQRDRVTGLWRPLLPGRAPGAALAALQPLMGQVLADRSPIILEAAADIAARLHIVSTGPALAALVGRSDVNAKVRLRALDALQALGAAEQRTAIDRAATDPDPALRIAALRLRVKLDPAQATTVADNALAHGSLQEKQLALHILGETPTPAAQALLLVAVDQVLAGNMQPGLVLDVLDAAAAQKSPKLQERLARYQAKTSSDDDLAPYAEALVGGDPEAGKSIFWSRAEVSCPRCHTVEGHGAEVGPELTDVGARRTAAELLESVVYPSKHFAPGFESTLVTMKDHSIHGGTVKSETQTALTLQSPDEGQVVLKKANILSREPGASGMPDGFGQILSKHDLRDLVAFLASLKNTTQTP